MYHVIALIGPAGSGKDTILKTALEKIPQLSRVVSYTTRPMREGEVNGRDYNFVSQEEFEEKLLSQELIEAAVFNGWGYGSCLNSFSKDKVNIMAIDPSRTELLLQCKDLKVYPYIVTASNRTRLLRQLKREDNPNIDEILRRYETDKQDYACLSFTYHSLPNENKKELKESINELRLLVKSI